MIARIILVLSAVYLIFFAIQNRGSYLSRFDGNYWLDRYKHSQYFQGEKSDYILSDAEADAVRGYEFVIQKKDPVHILPGHPPLGTYLIGLSILIFGNPNIAALLAGVVSLILIYRIVFQLTHRPLLASLAVVLTLAEPLFTEQLTTSLLDIYLLMFSLFSVSTYLDWLEHSRFQTLALSQLFLGFALATKFFPASFPLLGALYLTTILTGNFRYFLQHTLAFIFILVGFLIGHLTFFIFHPSFLEFARFERYIISWWAGTTQISPGTIWDLIFRNRWHTWWGNFEIVPVQTWWIGWPVATFLTLLSPVVLGLRKSWNLSTICLLLWIGSALLLDNFQAIYPRHLLPIFIAMYLMIPTMVSKHKMSPQQVEAPNFLNKVLRSQSPAL